METSWYWLVNDPQQVGIIQHVLYRMPFANLVALGRPPEQEEHGADLARSPDDFRTENHVWTAVGLLSCHVLLYGLVHLERFCRPGRWTSFAAIHLYYYRRNRRRVSIERHGRVPGPLVFLVC